MLKWLTKQIPSADSSLHWLLLPEPELLNRLGRQYRTNPSSPEVAAAFSRVVSSLWINKTNKLTASNRLTGTLNVLAAHLDNWRGDTLQMLDLGASDGITTLEAVQFVQSQLGIRVRAHAMDRFALLQRFDRWFIREYRTSDAAPVLLRVGPLALRLGRRLAIPLAEWFRRFYLRRHGFRNRMRRNSSISLLHPAAVSNPAIVVVEADALQQQPSLVNSMDVVRASNLFNESYFTDDQMATMIAHTFAYVRDGGLLIISRNVRPAGSGVEVEDGSIWRRQETKFEWLSDFGGGSSVKHLVENFRLETSSTSQTRRAA